MLELQNAKRELPSYPDHICGRAGLVSSASGLLMSDALSAKYGAPESEEAKKELSDNMERHALEVCAQAIRFLEKLKEK